MCHVFYTDKIVDIGPDDLKGKQYHNIIIICNTVISSNSSHEQTGRQPVHSVHQGGAGLGLPGLLE